MPNAEYYRQQAERCLTLASTAIIEELANHLVAMADDYKAKAEEAERREQMQRAE